MARLEVVQFAALMEAIDAERRTMAQAGRNSHSAIGRVLATAHELGRRSTPSRKLSDRKIS